MIPCSESSLSSSHEFIGTPPNSNPRHTLTDALFSDVLREREPKQRRRRERLSPASRVRAGVVSRPQRGKRNVYVHSDHQASGIGQRRWIALGVPARCEQRKVYAARANFRLRREGERWSGVPVDRMADPTSLFGPGFFFRFGHGLPTANSKFPDVTRPWVGFDRFCFYTT